MEVIFKGLFIFTRVFKIHINLNTYNRETYIRFDKKKKINCLYYFFIIIFLYLWYCLALLLCTIHGSKLNVFAISKVT